MREFEIELKATNTKEKNTIVYVFEARNELDARMLFDGYVVDYAKKVSTKYPPSKFNAFRSEWFFKNEPELILQERIDSKKGYFLRVTQATASFEELNNLVKSFTEQK